VILRPCSVALATALAAGARLLEADLFTVTLQGGTVYRWTSWSADLVVAGSTFFSSGQWLSRGTWGVKNTMEVPTLEVTLLSSAASFGAGGAPSLRTQLHNGLFDGATLLLQRLFMPAYVNPPDTSTYGTIDIFAGDVGACTLQGAKATLKVRGKNSRLSEHAPRNVYQPGCIHTFCDSGCTLTASSFTIGYTVGAVATRTVITLPVATTYATPAQSLKGGTLTMINGVAAGQKRGIIDYATFTPPFLPTQLIAVTLAYPLTVAPSPGDVFTTFSGCDKTLLTCANVYNNKVNFRGFPFVPPPATNAPGQ
jgi:uncharacterized phage protein (TIGR02218 family)